MVADHHRLRRSPPTLGGLVLGFLAAVLGALCPTGGAGRRPPSWSRRSLLLVGLALDLRFGGLALPSWRRQVDEAWIGRYRGWVVGVGFGAQLGFGLVTIITSSTTYAVVVLAVLSGPRGRGALLGGAFGLVRAVPLAAHAAGRHPGAALVGAARSWS